MLQFVGSEFEDFKDIAEFILKSNGKKIDSDQEKYRDSIGYLIGIEVSLKNSVFSSYHIISRHCFENFKKSFNDTIEGKKTKENQLQTEAIKSKFDNLTKVVLKRGDVDLEALKAERKASKKSQQDTDPSRLTLDPFMVKAFVHSTWFSHENDNGSIVRKVMKFGNPKNNTIDVIIQHEVASLNVSAICIYLSEENMMIIKPVAENAKSYTYYTILLDGLIDSKERCFGQLTTKGSRPYTLSTKTIILQKDNGDDATEKTSLLLQGYLQNANDDLVTSTNFDLQNPVFFQRQKADNDISLSYIHQRLLGDYAVFYKLELHDEELTENLVEILQTENKLKVRYTHNLTPDETITWEGKGYINFHSHTLTTQLLEMYDGSYSLENSRPTFLLIAIPEIAITKIEVLPGLLTGSRDHNLGSASRLVLLVKLDKEKLPENFNRDVIKQFFKYFRKSCWIDIPRTKQTPALYRFSDLVNIVKQYTKQFGIELPDFDS